MAGTKPTGVDVIGIEQILEWEDDVDSCRELIIRNHRPPLRAFKEDCARRLIGLEILSLSHNAFSNLAHFENFQRLQQLNLNFNNISALDGIKACQRLEELYLSCNKLDDSCLQVFASGSFPKLSVLCLYRNAINDFDLVIPSLRRGCRLLRRLDLAGNPCSTTPRYKHALVLNLPKLSELDGDKLSELDKDLAIMYVNRDSVNNHITKEGASQVRTEQSLEGSIEVPQDRGIERDKVPHKKDAAKRSRFVARLRCNEYRDCANALVSYEEKEQESEHKAGTREPLHSFSTQPNGSSKRSDRSSEQFVNPSSAHIPRHVENLALVEVAQSEIGVTFSDPSNPYQVIRRLLAELDSVRKDLKEAKASLEKYSACQDIGMSVNELAQENKILQLENENMFILKEENEQLKRRLAEIVREDKERSRRTDVPDVQESPQNITVAEENRRLRFEQKQLQMKFDQLRGACKEDRQRRELEKITAGRKVRLNSVQLQTDEEINGLNPDALLDRLDLEDDNEAEVEALIRRNAAGLRKIKRDLRKMKKKSECRGTPP